MSRYRLDVVIDVPDGTDIDDFIFEIEVSGALGADATISVSDVQED